MASLVRRLLASACLVGPVAALVLGVSGPGAAAPPPSPEPRYLSRVGGDLLPPVPPPVPPRPPRLPRLADGTCWSPVGVVDEPAVLRRIARRHAVPVARAAVALADAPTLTRRVPCNRPHHLEVVTTTPAPPAAFADLLRPRSPSYASARLAVAAACQDDALRDAAGRTGVPGAVLSPVLPRGTRLTSGLLPRPRWGGTTPRYACLLVQDKASTLLHTDLLTAALGPARRSCIVSDQLLLVPCERPHDRERIGLLTLDTAVARGLAPSGDAVLDTPDGQVVPVPDELFARLDAGCSALLAAVDGRATRLHGVAQVDADLWPSSDGSFGAVCEADALPGDRAITTTGSVFTRPAGSRLAPVAVPERPAPTIPPLPTVRAQPRP